MKKIFFYILSVLLFTACEDSVNGDIGASLRSEEDNINSAVDSFFVDTETIPVESVYADNSNFIIGNYSNEKFGSVTGSVVAQVIYPSAKKIKSTYVADSLTLDVHISKHTGKEETNFIVYKLKKLLEYRTKYFTNISAEEYVDFNTKIGEKTVNSDMLVLLDTAISKSKAYTVTIPLEKSLADDFLKDLSIYESESKFLEFFNGFYLQTDNKQQIFTVDSMAINLHYHFTQSDTIATGTLKFPANNEVRQVNKIVADVENAKNNKKPTEEYIFSPAGMFTAVTIPTRKIIEKGIGNNNKCLMYNSVILNIDKNDTDYDDEISAPSTLLFVHDKDVYSFFYEKKLPDGEESFYSTLLSNSTTGKNYYRLDLTYFFQVKADSISSGKKAIKDIEETDTFYLVPSRFTYSGSNLSLVQNSFAVSALSFKNSKDTDAPLSIVTTYSEFYKYK